MNPLLTREQLSRSAMRGQTDGTLVRLVRDGSEAASEEIVRRYRPMLFGFACTFVPADRAEDVLQESMVKALGALRRSDNEVELRPWLFAIVRNTALNEIRNGRTSRHAHDGLPAPVPATPEEEVERRVAFASMVAALTALPDSQRRALVGHEFEGRSHRELAAALNTTSSSIRGLIYRAREAMRSALGLLLPLPLLRPYSGGDGWVLAKMAGSGQGASGTTVAGVKLSTLGATGLLAVVAGVGSFVGPPGVGSGEAGSGVAPGPVAPLGYSISDDSWFPEPKRVAARQPARKPKPEPEKVAAGPAPAPEPAAPAAAAVTAPVPEDGAHPKDASVPGNPARPEPPPPAEQPEPEPDYPGQANGNGWGHANHDDDHPGNGWGHDKYDD